jgi:hypothetical protein
VIEQGRNLRFRPISLQIAIKNPCPTITLS